MSTMKKPPAFVTRLKNALVQDLKASGIDAEVFTEKVPTTRLHRVTVLAPKFKVLKHSERQNLVWRTAERTLSPSELMLVSMIVTLTPIERESA
jgi:hypothetical protein